MAIQHIRNQFLKRHPLCELKEVKPVHRLCREIRIQLPEKEGKVYYGYNTITETYEHWLCVQGAKDCNNTQMQRVLNYSTLGDD